LIANVRGQDAETAPSGFAGQVDLTPLRGVAVQDTGRLKSFDTFARNMLRYVSGSRDIRGQEPSFTYLDLMFRPESYADEDIIYVKKKQIRRAIAESLKGTGAADASRLERFQKTGLISPMLLGHPKVSMLLERLQSDLLRTAKSVDRIRGALRTADPRTLSFALRLVPPPNGGPKDEWFPVDRVMAQPDMPRDTTHAGLGPEPIAGLSADQQQQLSQTWSDLAKAWRSQDAGAATAAVDRFATLIGGVRPDLYPDLQRLSLESWYFRYKNLTWIWMFYLLALIPLLMSVIYKWDWARVAGLGLFGLAFAAHTAALLIRWYVAQRWPNSNMFEAVTTAAWFGGAIALVLEVLARKTALRNLFALGSGVASMAALMAAYYLPLQLNAHIGNRMPVLHDVWLYIHTNVIIASYCLIAMAAVTAFLYLVYRLFGGGRAVAKAGGAGSLIMGTGPGGSFLQSGSESKATAGQILDASTMVLMELSFILLWAGIVMGAIWADHSWGRPWGWDPKEVFALNTFVIFLLLVHVRIKVRDRGLWTALLAVLGCVVMMFNWIVVNFVITGLHSYA
ncbi:MAG: cytochrome c biogenesis protein CcsA, partial [Phycisphaerae bacterium]